MLADGGAARHVRRACSVRECAARQVDTMKSSTVGRFALIWMAIITCNSLSGNFIVAASLVRRRTWTAAHTLPSFVAHRTSRSAARTSSPVSNSAAAFQNPVHEHLSRQRVCSNSVASYQRKMSTFLRDSEQADSAGLSDIGQSANSDIANSDVNESELPNWKERIDISIAKSRKIRGSNYVQISTINYETMEPRCRTVVFRGFLKDVPFSAVNEVLGGPAQGDTGGKYCDCVMKMITDMRSNKVQELDMYHELKGGPNRSNTVEMVWWFPKSSEQYRVRGRLQFIGNSGPLNSYATDTVEASEKNTGYLTAERKQQWGNLSDVAREQFYWENPGIQFSSTWEQAKGVPPGGRDDEGKVLPPPDTFLLMLLYPTAVDYLRLGDNFRQIDEWVGIDGAGDDDSGHIWKSRRVNP